MIKNNMKQHKSKLMIIVIIVLIVLFILALGYIFIDKWQESRQSELIKIYQQGISDTVLSLYQQTENCQITTVNLGNATRQVVDVSCIKAP